MGKLARKRYATRDHRSERYGEIGRKFESEVADLLQKMQEEKLILGFVQHEPDSTEHRDGRDFTVTTVSGDKEASRSFGVTISMQHWGAAKARFPTVPQFCFPIGTKPETIRKRILELFAQP